MIVSICKQAAHIVALLVTFIRPVLKSISKFKEAVRRLVKYIENKLHLTRLTIVKWKFADSEVTKCLTDYFNLGMISVHLESPEILALQ